MKKPDSYLTVVFLFLTISIGYGQEKEERNVGSFEAFSVGSGIDAFYYRSNDFKVVVQSNSDLDDIETFVDNGELVVRHESRLFNFKWNSDDKVFIYAPTLRGVKASGGSDVESKDNLKSESLVLKASGGSDLRMDIDVEEVDVDCSGGSDVYLSGSATFFLANASGGSDIKAYELETEEADVHGSGGSDIQITVHKKLSASASGGSDIYYKGNPERVNVDSSSGSDIHPRQ